MHYKGASFMCYKGASFYALSVAQYALSVGQYALSGCIMHYKGASFMRYKGVSFMRYKGASGGPQGRSCSAWGVKGHWTSTAGGRR